jgi:aryl-alcohol dehydrogenase-like predicted oxidoreductase
MEEEAKTGAGTPPVTPKGSPFENKTLPKRRLGKTGVEVTVLGLGGEGLLRVQGREREAARLINTALDLGITYFESASAYDGSESYYGGALKGRRAGVFLAGKSHARDRSGAAAHLVKTLDAMKTDYLDLWSIHDVRSADDLDAIFAPGGAMEAFVEAKEKGLVRFIGVNGYHEPSIVKGCMESFDFDVVEIPVNPAEANYKCFMEEILPVAAPADTGIIGTKIFLRGKLSVPPRMLLSYALTQPIAVAVVDCDGVEQLKENVEAAMDFQMLKHKEVQWLAGFVSQYAKELMYYKNISE